jgi:hypothetical protein
MTAVEGLVPDAGIQYITALGQRGSFSGHTTGTTQRVGRILDAGFNTAALNFKTISTARYFPSFSVQGCSPLQLQGTLLELGDVTDGLVTGTFDGVLQVDSSSLMATGQTAFLARVCDGAWLQSLGPVAPGSRVPVLVQGSRVYVSVQRPDGGVELLDRNAATGVP